MKFKERLILDESLIFFRKIKNCYNSNFYIYLNEPAVSTSTVLGLTDGIAHNFGIE